MRTFFILLALVSLGCGKNETPVAYGEQRNQEIIKRSKGSWDSLPEADRQRLIQELGRGDERAARAAFTARTSVGGPPDPSKF
jgi:hypothetical protein